MKKYIGFIVSFLFVVSVVHAGSVSPPPTSSNVSQAIADKCASGEYVEGNTGNCVADQAGSGGTFNDTGMLQPDGLVIDTGGVSDSVSLAVGGAVDVSATSGDTNHQVVEIDAGDTADLGESGCNGLIKGSLTTDAWYKGFVLADDDGVNTPCMAFVQEGNTLTASDLPSGYELSRNMAEPGKNWWVKTDGSSNILGFENTSDGWTLWSPSAYSNFGIFFTGGQSSGQSIDASEQIPPTTVNIILSPVGGDAGELSLHNQSMSGIRQGQVQILLEGTDKIERQVPISKVKNQTFYIWSNDMSNIDILYATKFKAVK